MSDELNAAKLRIAHLEEELDEAKTLKQENNLETRLTTAMNRLEVLEKRSLPQPTLKEEEEEDGDQCPECGGMLYEIEDGIYECSLCKQEWKENEK